MHISKRWPDSDHCTRASMFCGSTSRQISSLMLSPLLRASSRACKQVDLQSVNFHYAR